MAKKYQGIFYREVLLMRWSEFLKRESSKQTTVDESIIIGWVRACVMEDVDAITSYIDRIDGKEAMPLQIVYPKVFYTFPYATESNMLKVFNKDGKEITDDIKDNVEELKHKSVEDSEHKSVEDSEHKSVEDSEHKSVEDSEHLEVIELDEPIDTFELHNEPSLKKRMEEMRLSSYLVPKAVVAAQALQEDWHRKRTNVEPEIDPQVQTVIAAHLLFMGQQRNMKAVNELVDRFYGKVAQKIRIAGEDVYIQNFSTVAPPGAYLNEEGIYQIEAPAIQDTIKNALQAKMEK